MGIVSTRRLAVRARRNVGLRTAILNRTHQRIGIIALVGSDRLRAGGLFEQRVRLGDVGLLGARYRERDRVTERVRNAVDFTAETAARAAQRLRTVFFWAPAACKCARTAVLSKKTSSRSRSPLTAVNTRSHTPLLLQRENRVNVVCQLPSCGGKSRQGAPVRMIHNTASRNSRLSFAVTPRSEAFPASNGSSFAHCQSFNSIRTTSSAPRN